MNSLNKNRLKLLVSELRSDKWIPSSHKGCLREEDNKRSVNGVACEVYMSMIGLGEWVGDEFVKNEVRRSNHIHNSVSIFFFGDIFHNIYTPKSDLQKAFELGKTFTEIADKLEEEWSL